MIELDKIDRRILMTLQAHNQYTNLELAERVHLSPPTCHRRVRRLREAKVIVADVSLLDPSLVARNFFVFVEVILEKQTEEFQRDFETKADKAPEVMQCYMVSGEMDFMLVVQVSDMTAYHRFVRRFLTGDPNIRNFRSLFAMNRTKFNTQLQLEP